MNHDPRIDALIERVLSDTQTSRAPDRLRADIALATSRRRQRPAWLTSLKEPPMRYRSRVAVGSSTLRIAVMMVVTAVLTLALAGAVIAGASPQPGPSTLPSPSAPPSVAPTWVTGTVQHVEDSCSKLGFVVEGGVVRSRYQCTQTWTASDPRLTGEVAQRWNEDVHQASDGAISVGIDARYLQNEGGGWACSDAYLARGFTPESQPLTGITLTCIGEGGYEGLSAVLVNTPGTVDAVLEAFSGLIFSGSLPAAPEAPAAP